MSALPTDEQDLEFLAERLYRTMKGHGWEEEWILRDDEEDASSDDGEPESSESEDHSDDSDDEDEEDNGNGEIEDPYANTSLQEVRLPVPTPEDFYHDQEYEDRHEELLEAVEVQDIDLLHRQQAYMRESRQENELAAAADRRADRLNAHRAKASGLVDVFSDTLKDWKAHDPSTYAKFITHMANATQASDVPARSFAILLWFPNLPTGVGMAIRDLVRHYHSEVALQKALDVTQMTGIMVDGNLARGLSDELYDVSDMTHAQWCDCHGITLEWINIFAPISDHANHMGADPEIMCFSSPNMVKGQEEAWIKHIRANFEARKILLESETWDTTDVEIRTPEAVLLEWCSGANQELLRRATVAAMNTKHVSRAVKKALAKLQNEIADMLEHLGNYSEELYHIESLLENEIADGFHELEHGQDQARKVAIKAELEKYLAEVEEFEKKFPRLAARELPEWRSHVPTEYGQI